MYPVDENSEIPLIEISSTKTVLCSTVEVILLEQLRKTSLEVPNRIKTTLCLS